MREAHYQAKLIKKLQALFPGCFILRNDPSENQGVPDILILYSHMWGMLECKLSVKSPVQPNQAYYVNMFNEMSFASFISPDTEEMVLNDLQFAFGIT